MIVTYVKTEAKFLSLGPKSPLEKKKTKIDLTSESCASECILLGDDENIYV